MNLQTIYRGLKNDLHEIESGLFDSLQTEQPDLKKASAHLLYAGGKRIRPVFVLLAGKFGDYSFSQVKRIAIALELIHMATLVHDDVIDDAETRRGELTVKKKWDNRIAMLAGNYIFSCAQRELCQFDNPVLHDVLSKAIVEMCRGEIEQIHDLYRNQLSVKRYLLRIKRKTALLIMVSCQLGAVVSQASREVQRDLTAYGYYVGMAFQIIDDVLDFTGTEKQLGKPAGSDLKHGNATLPAIYALTYASQEQQEIIRSYLHSGGEANNLSEVLEIICSSGGIEYTKGLAQRYLQKSLTVLQKLPAIKERRSLQKIAEFIVKRTY